MKFGVLVFPGSNCDHDTHNVLGAVMGQPVTYLWHESHDLERCDAILVPGGFAYGDYLRTGAIARFAPIMQSVTRFAHVRWAGHGHLQRLPDPLRGGPAPRCAHAQRQPALHMPPASSPRRDCHDSPFTSASSSAWPSPAHAHRTHGGQLLLRRRDARHAQSATTALPSATPPRPARSPPRPTPTARSPTSPASSAKAATCSA
jgi:hypothetical protein